MMKNVAVMMVVLAISSGCGRFSDIISSRCSRDPLGDRDQVARAVRSSVIKREYHSTKVVPADLDELNKIKEIHQENQSRGCSADIWHEEIKIGTWSNVRKSTPEHEWVTLTALANGNVSDAQSREYNAWAIKEELAENAAQVAADRKQWKLKQGIAWYKQEQELEKRAPQRDRGLECQLRQWNSTRHFSGNWGDMDGAVYIVLTCTNTGRKTTRINRSEIFLSYGQYQWALAPFDAANDDYSNVSYPNYDVTFLSHFEDLSAGETETYGFTFYPDADIVGIQGVKFDLAKMQFKKPTIIAALK